ncbi:MAG: serine/threonine protein kinase [Lachnospiraceae bacterium]|nr:serine/threonine protein kinase [Lachnospiraceae bacterium]
MKSWNDEYTSVLPDVLAETYEVLSCLKDSTESTSYLLQGKDPDSLYILKTASDPIFAGLLANEKNILDGIHHSMDSKFSQRFPYAVLLYEDPSSKVTFYIRTYIEGKTLEELCETNYEQAGLPLWQALDYIISLTDMLQFLHSMTPPLIHRDIKPQNIVIDVNGVCHFIDFGISRFYQSGKNSDTIPMGTRLTAPPEQFGFQQCDTRSDLYSLGVVLFYSLTGEYSLNPSLLDELDASVAAIIRRATMFDPQNRYQSAKELLSDLLAVRYPYVNQNPIGQPNPSQADDTPQNAPVMPAATEGQSKTTVVRKGTGKSRTHFTPLLPGVFCLFLILTLLLLVRFRNQPDSLPASEANTEASLEPVAGSTAESSPTYTFTEPLIEEAVREQLGLTSDEGITEADLEQVTALHIMGLQVYSDEDEIWFQGDYPYVYDDEMRESGLYEKTGTISSLEDLTHMPNLTCVCLYRQQITDISVLMESGLTITELGLGYNPLSDLTPLEGNDTITVLNLAGLDISDPSVIATLSSLRELNISATSISSLNGLENCPIEILNLFQVSLTDYTELEQLKDLRSLEIEYLSEPMIQTLKALSLETLFVHHMNGYSLGALSPLNTLEDLGVYVGSMETISLDGAAFSSLQTLDIKDATISDFYGLSSLTELSTLKIYSSVCESYDGLDALPNLRTIYCTSEQAEAMRAQYPEMDFYYSYAE